MAAPSLTPIADVESPEWWRDRLEPRLRTDRKTMNLWWRYHIGDHPPPEMPEKIRDKLLPTYRALQRRSRVNFMRMVVEAYADRMRPVGFWLGSDSDAPRDELSWRIWQASRLDRDIHAAFTWALAKGRSYLSVWAHDDEELPRISAESPTQVIVEHEPGRPERRAAALKVYHDQLAEEDVALVYLPDGVYEYRRRRNRGVPGSYEESDFFANPFNLPVVPIVPIYNRPETDPTEKAEDRPILAAGGDSEIADLVYIQDRINETVFNGLLAAWYSAFKQKWATGLTVEKVPKKDDDGNYILDDETGEPVMVPVEPFDLGADRLIVSEDENTKFGEFSETDLTGYIKLRERDLEDLTITSRLPRHYLIQQGQAPSGDSMVSAEAGFVGRIRHKFDDYADPTEEAVGIARAFAGEEPLPPDAELRWDDPENQSLAQLTDAVIKEYEAGLITREVAQERLNYSPQQIARMRGELAGDGLLQRVIEQQQTEAA